MTADTALHARNLVGPARALSRRAHNDVEAGLATPPAEGDATWVSPADILAKRLVPLPPPLAEALRSAGDGTTEACSTASTIATIHSPARLVEVEDVPGPQDDRRGGRRSFRLGPTQEPRPETSSAPPRRHAR